jgi:putative ABC transport system substrate-binding protein
MAIHIRRREFIFTLGGAAAAWPLAARAQQTERERRIGLLTGEDVVVFVGAFREELHKLGWSDGRNLRIDRRASAADLIAINPDVMVAENYAGRSGPAEAHTHDPDRVRWTR